MFCVCVPFSTGEPGVEALLDVLFEELALRQKSGTFVCSPISQHDKKRVTIIPDVPCCYILFSNQALHLTIIF